MTTLELIKIYDYCSSLSYLAHHLNSIDTILSKNTFNAKEPQRIFITFSSCVHQTFVVCRRTTICIDC